MGLSRVHSRKVLDLVEREKSETESRVKPV
jgi:hypothetical protein